jgi:hypothetical protein
MTTQNWMKSQIDKILEQLCKTRSLQRDFSVRSALIKFAAMNFRLGFSSEGFAISKVWRGI